MRLHTITKAQLPIFMSACEFIGVSPWPVDICCVHMDDPLGVYSRFHRPSSHSTWVVMLGVRSDWIQTVKGRGLDPLPQQEGSGALLTKDIFVLYAGMISASTIILSRPLGQKAATRPTAAGSPGKPTSTPARLRLGPPAKPSSVRSIA